MFLTVGVNTIPSASSPPSPSFLPSLLVLDWINSQVENTPKVLFLGAFETVAQLA